MNSLMESNNREIAYGEKPNQVIGWVNDHLKCDHNKICLAKGWCKRCGLCIAFCPVKALDKDAEGYPIVNNEKCISCGNCEIICPDFAIVVAELKEKKRKTG